MVLIRTQILVTLQDRSDSRDSFGGLQMLGELWSVETEVSGKVYDLTTRAPVVGAMLDVWQAATNGLYENQGNNQPDYNFRGRFQTDKDDTSGLVALLPTPYPVPTDGPVCELTRLAKRQAIRPAHIHFIVSAPDYETLVTQVFRKGDAVIDENPAVSADRNLIGEFYRGNGQYRLLLRCASRIDGERAVPPDGATLLRLLINLLGSTNEVTAMKYVLLEGGQQTIRAAKITRDRRVGH
jgi:hypothetical protein